MNKNCIKVEGIIYRISYKHKDRNLICFEVARNREYLSSDGMIVKDTSFFSAIINFKELIKYKDLLKVGSKVVVSGIPNSYFNKDKQKCFTIKVLELFRPEDFVEEEKSGPKISIDTDGVMLWNGERCEIKPMDPEEEKEVNDILSKYE